MKLKLSVKVPSFGNAVNTKVMKTFSRALATARTRIVPLVVDRAQMLVDKAAPAMASRYKKALAQPRAVEVTEKDVVLTITDPLVIAAEKGMKAFDLKKKLLAHAKHTSKKGVPYVDIPFTHKAGEIPSKIRAAASKAAKGAGGAAEVRVSMKTEGRSFVRSLQRGSIGQALGISTKKQKVTHKRGIHDDLIRSGGTGKGSSPSYTTMRRISAASSSTSWWHPGFKAAHVLDKALTSVKRDVAAIIRDAFAAITRGSA